MLEQVFPPIIKAAVEGMLDEAVARQLICYSGGEVGDIYGRGGKHPLLEKLSGYNNAARYEPWIILIDLDSDADCAPPMREAWLPDPAPQMCFRIAVREIETWLMADAQTLAAYLSVAVHWIPQHPEKLEHPKDSMIHLARRSRRREVRQDMVPREKNGRRAGPAYVSRLAKYVETEWRPDVAARRSESLRRAICCLRRLVSDHHSRPI